MTWTDVAFVVFAVGSVPAGIGVFLVNSMARATWLLLASFLGVGGVLLLLGGNFLGAVLVLMVVAEMTIMVIFMLTLMGMNASGLMSMTMVHNRRGSWLIAAGTFVLLTVGIFTTPWPKHPAKRAADDGRALGLALMGPKMLVMMIFGVALFATIIAGIVLATHRGRYDRYGDRLAAKPPSDPIPGGLR
jgi:NADH-quinone oxidoreductase subunit J